MGTVEILNVSAGDMKITYDTANPAEVIRANRVIKDMLRRGYALLVEVEREGQKAFERALDFDEKAGAYIVADFDPVEAALARKREREAAEKELSKPLSELVGPKEGDHGQSQPTQETTPDQGARSPARGRKHIPASKTRAVAVPRSAGG